MGRNIFQIIIVSLFTLYESSINIFKSDGNNIKEKAFREKQKSTTLLGHELMNFSLLAVASKRQRKDVVGVKPKDSNDLLPKHQ